MLRLKLLLLVVLIAACGASQKTQPTPPPPLPPPAVQPPSPNLPRSTTDRPDEVSGYQVHVLYTLPADGTDRELDKNGTIATSVAAFQKWFKSQTGGTALRLDTYQGKPDISFVRLSRSDAQIKADGDNARDTIEVELLALGFNDPKKIYAVYHDGSHNRVCGAGPWPPLLVGTVGALFLKGTPLGAPPCADNPFATSENQPGYQEFSMLHEIMHTLGATPQCAPNSRPGDASHTTNNPQDLMYAGTGGWQPSVILDPDRNDYFGHGKPGCLDLAKSVFLEPLPASTELPPGWPLVSLPDVGCDKAGQVQSSTGKPVKLRIANARNEVVEVFWVNGNGQPILSASLQPFAKVEINTDTTHPFLIKNQAGVCRGLFRTGELLSGMGLALVK